MGMGAGVSMPPNMPPNMPSVPASPQRRDRISERAFIECLARRVSAHFAKIGDPAAGRLNQKAIRAAAAAHAACRARGDGTDGGASAPAVAAAAAALEVGQEARAAAKAATAQ